MIRNFIDIVGITPENELPREINGQLMEVSQTDKLFIDDNIQIKNIYQIIISTDIKGTRVINTKVNKIIVIDAYKKFKIAYYDMDNNMKIFELSSPCNLFFDIEDDKTEIQKTNLYIADAYFELINNKVLYNHILYIIDIHYFGTVKRLEKTKKNNENFIDKNNNNYYTENNGSGNYTGKNYTLKEISISEDEKIEFKERGKLHSNINNQLIDIEAEYL